ncbi:MAG: DegT/DnrJ/EryC1/StrS family aminotransferase [Candidatus Omnitrophica bacterium]|nr:DegT/DnrJ/EryC1/StrS family aminotransferase [Candidatus Omnitrophota bacterium]
MKVPLMNIQVQYDQLKTKIDDAITEIASSSKFILGKETEIFEREIAAYCDARYAVGVGSGTEALILALTALGIGKGDEVITTPATFIATAESISRVGARPVFADIDRDTYNIDPGKIEEAVTPRTKAIIPVHLFGNPCDMDRIMDIAGRHNLKVIEDTAQAIGATYNDKKVGSFGDAGCLSFFPSKNLGAFGDGGMILVNDGGLYKKLRLLRVHGTSEKYHHSIIGFNSRLDNLQATILTVKLKKLDDWNERRRRVAKRYDEELKGLVETPSEANKGRHVYHLYIIRVEKRKRDGLMKFLNDNGIESRVYYPLPVHLQECYKDLGYKKGDFPEAEAASTETLALPLFPEIKDDEQRYVIDKLKKGLKACN